MIINLLIVLKVCTFSLVISQDNVVTHPLDVVTYEYVTHVTVNCNSNTWFQVVGCPTKLLGGQDSACWYLDLGLQARDSALRDCTLSCYLCETIPHIFTSFESDNSGAVPK